MARTILNSQYTDEVDHIQFDRASDLNQVWDCYWSPSFTSRLSFRNEFPLSVRREYYDNILPIPHRHVDFMALYIVRRGRGTRIVNGHLHSMARGDIFLMTEDNVHAYDSAVQLYVDAVYFHRDLWSENEWRVLHQLPSLEAYSGPGIEAFAARENTDYFGHLSSEPHAKIEFIFDTMRDDFLAASEVLHLTVRNQFFNLLVQLCRLREAGLFATRPARGAGVAEVLSFCDNNFQKLIKTEQLAAMMHFSDAHFRDVFTREVGMPPAAYLRRLRLQHAKTLLNNPQLPVAEIAHLSGFDGSTQFGRAFKKTFGVSPLEFRKNKKTLR